MGDEVVVVGVGVGVGDRVARSAAQLRSRRGKNRRILLGVDTDQHSVMRQRAFFDRLSVEELAERDIHPQQQQRAECGDASVTKEQSEADWLELNAS